MHGIVSSLKTSVITSEILAGVVAGSASAEVVVLLDGRLFYVIERRRI
jgi:hypothetical protein